MPKIPQIQYNILELWRRLGDVESDIADGIEVVVQEPNLTGSGLEDNPVRLSDDIAVSTVTASNILVTGTASIAMLNTVNQTSLQVGDKYITIMSGANTHATLNGAGILYGSGSADSTTGDQSSVAHIVYRSGVLGDYTSDYLEAYPGLRVSGSLTSSGNIYAPQITASQNIRIQNLPNISYTDLVVVNGDGTFGKTTAPNNISNYAEGNWNLTTNPGSDFAIDDSRGWYTRVGNLVYIWARFRVRNAPNDKTNYITGVPIASRQSGSCPVLFTETNYSSTREDIFTGYFRYSTNSIYVPNLSLDKSYALQFFYFIGSPDTSPTGSSGTPSGAPGVNFDY